MYYATPEDVAEMMDLADPSNNYGHFSFSEYSHPNIRQVEKMIATNEDIIDRDLLDSWRPKFVKNEYLTVPTYWHDENGVRGDYYAYGGYRIQLDYTNICGWDPAMGDKVELRNFTGQWVDVTQSFMGDNPSGASRGASLNSNSFWIDYTKGSLYISRALFNNASNGLRISYHYGKPATEIPDAINRLCCLMTARDILTNQLYNVKVGQGDAMQLRDTLEQWQRKEAEIRRTFQRIGPVISLYR